MAIPGFREDLLSLAYFLGILGTNKIGFALNTSMRGKQSHFHHRLNDIRSRFLEQFKEIKIQKGKRINIAHSVQTMTGYPVIIIELQWSRTDFSGSGLGCHRSDIHKLTS